jgi:type I restriction enzyme S subunit
MDRRWESVKISEVVMQNEDTERVSQDRTYKLLGVRLGGRGPFIKEEKHGSEIRANRLRKVAANQFIYSRLFAWRGAFGVIPGDLDGCYVSNEFPTFDIQEDRLVPKYLFYYFNQRHIWTRVEKKCMGTTGASRNRYKEKFFLNVEIPLPPIEEQRRIVVKIESLLEEMQNMAELRAMIDRSMGLLMDAAFNRKWRDQSDWNEAEIASIASIASGQIDPQVEPYASLPHINGKYIESGTGRLLSGYRTAEEDGITSGKYHFEPGAVLYSKIRPYLRKAAEMTFEGVCSAHMYVSDRFESEILPRFFMYSLISPLFTKYANSLSGRTRIPKLNQKQVSRFMLPYPSIDEQQRIIDYLDRVQDNLGDIRKAQEIVTIEVKSLVPSILNRAFEGGFT